MSTRKSEALAEINVTPLIDVLLVLLIVFMLVAPLGRARLDASLPGPAPAAPPAPPAAKLQVLEGGYSLDGRPVADLAELESRLRERLAGQTAPRVLVQAAGRASYARVVAALDVTEGAGATAALLPPLPTAARR